MPVPSLIDHFAALDDPRQSWKVLFPLPEVLLLVLCATRAGAEDFVEIKRWGQMHQAFLRRLLPYKVGIPSHDTLNDVINAIDGGLFAECFTTWVEGLREPTPACATAPEVVAIDGKTSRRSHDRSKDRGPLHLVSAWASSQRLVLGQQACEAKSNEITAIPLLLERLALCGALVTIDAMGTQTRIAQAIIDRGGDYLLALKDSRLRSGSGPQNMATVRHMAMNLLRGPKDKHSLKVRRKSAAWDTAYLEALLRRST